MKMRKDNELEKFAIQHLNCRVRTDAGVVAKIVGYWESMDCLIVEYNDDYGTMSLEKRNEYINGLYGVKILNTDIRNNLGSPSIRNVKLLEMPEDCLDCDAIGSEPCKDGCPNK
jgi:hypothetical protein